MMLLLALLLALDGSCSLFFFEGLIRILGLFRVGVSTITLLVCRRWGMVNKHIQAEGLAAAYSEQLREPLVENESPEMVAYQARRRAERFRTLCLGSAFVCQSANTIVFAIQTVRVEQRVDYVLLGLFVLAVVEFYVLKAACDSLTKEKGHLIPGLHNHKLYFWPKLPYHNCDLCMKRIMARAYRCKRCDFDVCGHCFDGGHGVDESNQQRNEKKNAVIISLLKGLKRYVFLAVVCLLATATSKIGLPNFQGRIIDAVFDKNQDLFKRDLVICIIFSAILIIFGVIRDACINFIGRMIAARVRNQLFQNMVHQRMAFFERQHTGNLTSTLISDVNSMIAPWKAVMNGIIGNFLVIIGGILMCLLTSWRLTWIVVACIVPVVYVISVYARWSTQLNREIWSGISDSNKVAVETFSNMQTVKALGIENMQAHRFANGDTLAKGLRDAMGSALTAGLTNNLNLVGTALVLGYGGWQALYHPYEALSPGDLVTFHLYWTMVNQAWKDLISNVDNFTRGRAASLRIMQMLVSTADEDEQQQQQQQQSPNAKGHIVNELSVEFRNVQFAYPGVATSILKDISMTLPTGTVTCVIGKSGAGKTTLCQLLERFHDPSSGMIFLNGTPIHQYEVKELRRHIAWVAPSSGGLFATTILENLTLGLDSSEFTPDDVMEACKAANCHDFIMNMQFGYQSHLHERGSNLSCGEQTKLLIARALLRKPKLLLLDEPLNGLDETSATLVMEALEGMLQSPSNHATVLLVTHRVELIQRVFPGKEVYVLERGQLFNKGNCMYEKE